VGFLRAVISLRLSRMVDDEWNGEGPAAPVANGVEMQALDVESAPGSSHQVGQVGSKPP
jgi:hypothetical protein